MYFDRFDIVQAHYWFLTDYHEGQNSDRYRRLCDIVNVLRYRPGACERGPTTDNARDIYDSLVARDYQPSY